MQHGICVATLCCAALLATTLAAPASIILASLIDEDVDSGDASTSYTSNDAWDNFVQHFRLTKPVRHFDEDFHYVPRYHVDSSRFRPMTIVHVVRRPTFVLQTSRPSHVVYAEKSKTLEIPAVTTGPEVETTHNTETTEGPAEVTSETSGDVSTSMKGVADLSIASEATGISGDSVTSEVAIVTESSLDLKDTTVSGGSESSESTKTADVSDVSEKIETSEASETEGDSGTAMGHENVDATVASEVTEDVEAGHRVHNPDVSVASESSEVSQEAKRKEIIELSRKALEADSETGIAEESEQEATETENAPEFAALTSDEGNVLISAAQVLEKREDGTEITNERREISEDETEVEVKDASSSVHNTEHRNVISISEPNTEDVESQNTEGLQEEVGIVIDAEAKPSGPSESSASEAAGVELDTTEEQGGEEEEEQRVEITVEEEEEEEPQRQPEESEREGFDIECKCRGDSGVKLGKHPLVHPPIWKPIKRTSQHFIQSLIHKPITERFDYYDRYSQILGYEPFGIF